MSVVTAKRRKTTRPTSGPQTLQGSREAKRQAAVLLEVLSGLRGPQEGSQALGVSLNRYYQLETRALQGFIQALEPRPKGRQRTPESELAELRRDKERLTRELSRNQALLRAAQRSLGLPRARAESNGSKLRGKVKTTKSRRRTRTVRATKAIAALRRVESDSPSQPAAESAAS
jgi:hypothetical protein